MTDAAGKLTATDHMTLAKIIAELNAELQRKPDIDEAERQLIIRALAVQSLESPGFRDACRKIAVKLQGGEMFDEFMRLLADLFEREP